MESALKDALSQLEKSISEKIVVLSDDIKTLRGDIKHIDTKIGDIAERVSKLEARQEGTKEDYKKIEIAFATQSEFYKNNLGDLRQELEAKIKNEADYAWKELRNSKKSCEISRANCQEAMDKKINTEVRSGNLINRVWILTSVVLALMSILMTIFRHYLQ